MTTLYDTSAEVDTIRLCVACHRRMDAYRRKERGGPLSACTKEVMPNV